MFISRKRYEEMRCRCPEKGHVNVVITVDARPAVAELGRIREMIQLVRRGGGREVKPGY